MAKILVVQCSSKFGDIKENLLKLEHTLKDSIDKDEKIDLVVVPEFFATSTDYVNHVVDENGGEILDTVKKLAKHYHTNFIAGSIVRKVGNKLYNSSFALNRNGEVIGIYDKIHLFNYFGGQECTKSTPGSKICCVDFDFGKTGIAICFDIRYPLQFRDMMKLGVKMIVLPTAWIFPKDQLEDPAFRQDCVDIWRAMAKTRAYDNEVYFVVCNQTGVISPVMEGLGNSMVVSPYGKIEESLDTEEDVIKAYIDFNKVDIARDEFPVHELI